MREIATRVLVIFPFEEAIYRDARRAGRVRRPSAGRSREAVAAARVVSVAGLDRCAAAPTVALLPGSRAERGVAHPAGPRRGRQRSSARACRTRSSSSRGRRTSTTACSTVRARLDRRPVAVVEADTDTVLASPTWR